MRLLRFARNDEVVLHGFVTVQRGELLTMTIHQSFLKLNHQILDKQEWLKRY